MTTLSASEARIPPDTLNRVAYKGERVRIHRRGGPTVVLVAEEDLALLEAIEDHVDAEEAKQALARMRRQGEKPLDWDKVKASLGL